MSLVSFAILTLDKFKSISVKDPNKIYFIEDKGYIYKGDKLFTESKTIPAFVITSALYEGTPNIVFKAMQDGIIDTITAICTNRPATNECIIDIEKTSEEDYRTTGGTWTSIFQPDKLLKIKGGEYSNDLSDNYTVNNNIINKGDMLRLKIVKSGKIAPTDNALVGLTVQLLIKA